MIETAQSLAGSLVGEAADNTRDAGRSMDRFLADVERRAYRFALVACGNEADALDIVQDAMFKLVQRYGDRDDSQWPALFHRILQSKIRDWYRRSRVRNRWRLFSRGAADEEHDPVESAPAAEHHEPGGQVEREAAMEALDEALRRLPLRQQQAVMLRLWEGLSVSETAHAMACSEGSVKTHYFRAVHALRESLGEHWP